MKCLLLLFCSGKEHQNADWIGIHEKICSYLKVLRSPMPFIASQDERETKRLEMLELKACLLLFYLILPYYLAIPNYLKFGIC